MKSPKRGKSTSRPEVTNISAHGFWLLIAEREYFIGFEHNPWFRDATVREILDVKLPHKHHLHWPAPGVDLELESLDRPEKYSLVYK